MNKPADKVIELTDQQRVCEFLTAKTENEADHIATHCAHIFLIGDHAFKIKRDVTYNYLDMSTLEQRRQLCQRELVLNKRVLPEIYLSIVPITVDADGFMSIDGYGVTVEWALKMRRFAQSEVVENIALAHGLTPDLAKAIGLSVAEYHHGLPSEIVSDGHARISEVYEELIEALDELKSTFDRAELDEFAAAGAKELAACRENLDSRGKNGRIKRCHGDLHLRNLLLTDRGPIPFDALEFDERLATTDVLYDVAFLLMDLGHRGLHTRANAVLNEYLLHNDPEQGNGLRSLPLFLYCRAGIKAMTTAQAALYSSENASVLEAEARQYLSEANAYLKKSPPHLIAIGGLSGSGKSTVAREIAVQISNSPGALVLRSDAERKITEGLAETTRLPESHYTPENAKRNYDQLLEKARIALQAGETVIIDAVFLDEPVRAQVRALAEQLGVGFTGCWLEAPTDVLTTRLGSRHNDVSDADVGVLHKQLGKSSVPVAWDRIDASGSVEDTVKLVMTLLTEISGL